MESENSLFKKIPMVTTWRSENSMSIKWLINTMEPKIRTPISSSKLPRKNEKQSEKYTQIWNILAREVPIF